MQLLREVGFDFGGTINDRQAREDAGFKMNVELLKEFKEKHGHTNVKKNNGKSLENFCQSMRYSYSQRQRGILKTHTKLTDERIQLLREIGFDFAGSINK
jgi:hypothetical protein